MPETTLTLALDAMGGDKAPESVIEAAADARDRYPGIHYLIYGDEARLAPLVKNYKKLPACSTVIHCEKRIANDEKPSAALRGGKGSSMWEAIAAVKEGKAQGIVSAGNTGALMAIARLQLRTLPGIDRPAIVSTVPTKYGDCVMLDLGANLDCTSEHLFQFAVMGDAFARAVLGHEKPRIGLLNVGSEETKGNDVIRETHERLKKTDLPLSFHGYVEGHDIACGKVDVVVADGFAGNVALKTAEGVGDLCAHFLKMAFRSSLLSKIGYLFCRPALTMLFKRLDPRHYNGAMLVGLNGIVVKSHGGMDGLGFANAIGVAVEIAKHNINELISEEMQRSHGGNGIAKHMGAAKAPAPVMSEPGRA